METTQSQKIDLFVIDNPLMDIIVDVPDKSLM